MSKPSSEDQPNGKRDNSRLLEGVEIKKLIEFGLVAADENAGDFPVIPGYEVIKLVGQGGMGKVFLGTQLSLNREVAIKVISLGGASRELMLDRLEREAHIMAKLSHPNLVGVIDFIKLQEQNSAIVMEWIDGDTLQISDPSLRPLDEVMKIGTQIASCLAAAHEVGVIHRDIKPSNLIVDPRGDIRVTDFGLALDSDANDLRLTDSGAAVGTIGYVAPEQLQGKAIDHRADLFSLGVVLYELLVGELPVGNFQSPKKSRPEIPKSLDRLVASLLQQKPQDRPKTAREVLSILEKENLNPSRRTGLKTAAGTFLALAGGLGVWAASRKKGEAAQFNLLEGKIQILRGDGWKNTTEGYLSSAGIELLGIPDQSLDLPVTIRVSFTRQRGTHAVSVFFRHPNGFGSVELSTWRKNLGGLQMLDNVSLENNPNAFTFSIKNGEPYLLEIQIDNDSVRTFIDGELKQVEPIKDRQLTLSPLWNWDDVETDGCAIMLGSFHSPTLFHSVEVVR